MYVQPGSTEHVGFSQQCFGACSATALQAAYRPLQTTCCLQCMPIWIVLGITALVNYVRKSIYK